MNSLIPNRILYNAKDSGPLDPVYSTGGNIVDSVRAIPVILSKLVTLCNYDMAQHKTNFFISVHSSWNVSLKLEYPFLSLLSEDNLICTFTPGIFYL